MSSTKNPICPIDPSCIFWPKGQCSRPYKEHDACWNCGKEMVRELNKEIGRLEKELEKEILDSPRNKQED